LRVDVAEAAQALEAQGRLERAGVDHSARIIAHVGEQLGRALPSDLEDFYRERIAGIGGFQAIWPIWNDWVGWRPMAVDSTRLLHVQAVPIFFDGCGSLYGLDLAARGETPAVYFFDHEDGFATPQWAAGSSLGAFLLLLADHDRAYREHWPDRWQLSIDPDIDKCPRAPAIWNAD
jgi:hypothetical protein